MPSTKKIIPAVITFLIILALFFLRNFSVVEKAQSMTVGLFSPLMRGKEFIAFRDANQKKAQDEEYLHTLEFAVASLREENGNLKKALSFKDNRHIHLVAFPVLTYSRDRNKEYLLVDINGNTALREGSLALTQNGVVVGKIKEVNGSIAKITVGSDPDEVYDTVAVSGARVLAKGIGARTLQLEMLSAESPIAIDEFIGISLSSSTDPLLFAKVVNLEEQNSKAFQGATAVLIARPEMLREVFFIQ